MRTTSTPLLAAGALVAATPLLVNADAIGGTGTIALPIAKRNHRDTTQPARIYKRQSNAGTVEESIFDVLPWSLGGAYYTNVTVGTPPQTLTVILDSGSSDLYVDASSSQPCKDTQSAEACRGGSFDPTQSKTYKVAVPNGFNTSFGDGSTAAGDFGTDTVGIGDVSLQDVQFGVASTIDTTTGFSVSLMGIGYSANEATRNNYPNMPEILHQSGAINSRLYSVFLNELGDASGTILFGGIDTSKYTGQLATLNILPDPSYQENIIDQFIVAVTGVSVNNNGKTTTYLQNGDATGQSSNSLPVLLDTGSSAWTVPPTIYNEMAEIFGSALDDYGNLPCSHQNDNINMTVVFGGVKTVTVPVRDLIVPVYDPTTNKQNTTSSGQPLCTFMISPDYQNAQMEEAGFLTLGDAVLRSMYVVFDLDNGQLSIAQAIANASTDAGQSSSGSNIKVVKAGVSGVANAVGSANSGVATVASQSASVAPEITATKSLGFQTASAAVGTATGLAAVPGSGSVGDSSNSGSGSGTSSGSGSSSSSTTHKSAAGAVAMPAFSWAGFSVLGVWVAMAGLGFGLCL